MAGECLRISGEGIVYAEVFGVEVLVEIYLVPVVDLYIDFHSRNFCKKCSILGIQT
jgi:hypothetical protein